VSCRARLEKGVLRKRALKGARVKLSLVSVGTLDPCAANETLPATSIANDLLVFEEFVSESNVGVYK
jgi:hypothetical protein